MFSMCKKTSAHLLFVTIINPVSTYRLAAGFEAALETATQSHQISEGPLTDWARGKNHFTDETSLQIKFVPAREGAGACRLVVPTIRN